MKREKRKVKSEEAGPGAKTGSKAGFWPTSGRPGRKGRGRGVKAGGSHKGHRGTQSVGRKRGGGGKHKRAESEGKKAVGPCPRTENRVGRDASPLHFPGPHRRD